MAGSRNRVAPAVIAVVLSLLPACGSDVPASKATIPPKVKLGKPYIGALTFAWKAGCSVPVAETVTKRGTTAELEYRLAAEPHGEELLISFRDMTMRRYDGKPVRVGQARAVAGFKLPDFAVDQNGALLGVRGMQELMDELGAIDSSFENVFTPEGIALLEDTVASKYWENWVGFWAGFASIDTPHFETTVSMALEQTTFDTAVVVDSLATTRTGDAVLRYRQTVDGEDFLRAIGAVSSAMGADEIAAAIAGSSGSRVTTVEITTDPRTLRPSTVSMVLDIELTRNGKRDHQVEKREWDFHWSAIRCNDSQSAG